MGARADRWDEPKRSYLSWIREQTGVVFELERRGSRWASGPAGSIGIMASDTRDGERWWLSLDENEFGARRALGLILLCKANDALLGFGLSRERVLELLPKLGRDRSKGERKFNLARRRDRYLLQLPGEGPFDMTSYLGDLSWLKADSPQGPPGVVPMLPRPTVPRTIPFVPPHGTEALVTSVSARESRQAGTPQADERAFFARVQRGLLKPLDPTGLPEGALVRVRATITPSAPSIPALRRIIAAGGPGNLPEDLAERHDHYAHGTRK